MCFLLPIIKMEIRKLLVLDQNSQQMEDLANKNGTTYGICGFVTCAVVEYLASQDQFTPETLKNINASSMEQPIDRVMKAVLTRRRQELKKFYKIMSDNDRKKYIKNWVANYEIADYLEGKSEEFKNKQVYFFRQSAFDHPELMKDVELEEKERIGEEEPFRGHRFFYSSFNPYGNHFKESFEEVLRKADQSQPIIIATDILGHFYTVVLFQGRIYILDTLSAYMDTRHDSQIVECIEYLYKQSYLVKPLP